MTLVPFGFARSATPRKRQGRSPRKAAHKPTFDRLEDRCLLAVTYTTPPAFDPVAEMVYGPAGDIWFSRVQDLSITRIASDGTIQEYGVLASVAQPVNLEVDANDNLWFTSASNAPANNLFRLTPAGALTEISDFTSSFNWVNQDPVLPIGFLTNAHVTTTNTLLAGLKARANSPNSPQLLRTP